MNISRSRPERAAISSGVDRSSVWHFYYRPWPFVPKDRSSSLILSKRRSAWGVVEIIPTRSPSPSISTSAPDISPWNSVPLKSRTPRAGSYLMRSTFLTAIASIAMDIHPIALNISIVFLMVDLTAK